MQIFGEMGRWFGEQPVVTKYMLVLSLTVPVFIQFGVLPARLVYYSTQHIARLQLWRTVTSVFFTKPSLPWLFNVFYRYQYSLHLEAMLGQADYLYFVLLCVVGLNVRLAFCSYSLHSSEMQLSIRLPCGMPFPWPLSKYSYDIHRNTYAGLV